MTPQEKNELKMRLLAQTLNNAVHHDKELMLSIALLKARRDKKFQYWMQVFRGDR